MYASFNNNIIEHYGGFFDGASGTPGTPGPPGERGARGDTGETGPKGDKGDIGSDFRKDVLDDLTFNFKESITNFNVKPTNLWGDGKRYTIINQTMLQEPSIVPNTIGGVAKIKYGKTGTIDKNTWW